MRAIAVADKNWGIGKRGRLLARLPGDMRRFRETTTGKVIVMGRATLDGLPDGAPLRDRLTVVLSRDPAWRAAHRVRGLCEPVASEVECMRFLSRFDPDEIFVAGGTEIYARFLPRCDAFLLTRIDAAFDADRFIENLDENADFEIASEGEPLSENGLSYRFLTYRRVGSAPVGEIGIRD